ncbi:MAG: class I SAM-dependent methyltransferase, partial [Acidobacteriia bacterium]|nr:class I SAM-dependent methyltransferase [Terriglobia bacterium]
LSDSGWKSVRKILDYGCGHGYYLSLLGGLLPQASLVGFDVDDAFIDTARATFGNVASFTSKMDDAELQTLGADALVLRLILHHNPDPAGLLSTLVSNLKQLQYVYIVNPCDTHFHLVPELKHFLADLAELRQPGRKRRDIHDEMAATLRAHAFTEVERLEIVVRAATSTDKSQMFAYMIATACYGGRTTPRSETAAELVRWLLDPNASAQYGLIASVFSRRARPADE